MNENSFQQVQKYERGAFALRTHVEYADGKSPRAIARSLNADGIPGPRGDTWMDTTMRGHVERGTGIINNELYVGRLVRNRLRYIKDPDTGKRVSRLNLQSEWIDQDAPDRDGPTAQASDLRAKSIRIGQSGRSLPLQRSIRCTSVRRMDFSSSIFWSSSPRCRVAKALTSVLARLLFCHRSSRSGPRQQRSQDCALCR